MTTRLFAFRERVRECIGEVASRDEISRKSCRLVAGVTRGGSDESDPGYAEVDVSNRLSRITGLLVMLLLGSVGSDVKAEEKLELRLRLGKGEVYRLRLTVEQHVVQTPAAPPARAGGKESATPQAAQSVDQSVGVGYTMSVDDVDADGAMTITTKYDSVVFRQKGPAGATEYDSTKPPKVVPPSAKAFAALPGLSFRQTVTAGGTVRSVEGLDEMLAEIVRRLELPEGPARASMLKALGEQFGEGAMKQNLQDLFAIYPPGPVAVGETWARKVVVSRGFPLVIDSTYTLKGRSGGVAEVAMNARLAPNTDAAPVELGTGRMTYALSGEQHGVVRIHEATGWTQSLTTEQDVSGTLTLDTPGDKDAAIPVTVKSRVVVEPVEAK